MSEGSEDRDFSSFRHEIANALLTVRGYAELMLLREDLAPDTRRYSEQIIMAVDRTTRKIDQQRSSATKASLATAASKAPMSENVTGRAALSEHQRTG
jgi:signal transduction histidine kinase